MDDEHAGAFDETWGECFGELRSILSAPGAPGPRLDDWVHDARASFPHAFADVALPYMRAHFMRARDEDLWTVRHGSHMSNPDTLGECVWLRVGLTAGSLEALDARSAPRVRELYSHLNPDDEAIDALVARDDLERVRALRFTSWVSTRHLEGALDAPASRALESLQLGTDRARIGVVLDRPALSTLRRLHLGRDEVEPEHVRRLGSEESLGGVRELIASCRLGGLPSMWWATTHVFSRLTSLDLSGNGLTTEHARELAGAPWRACVEELLLGRNDFGDEGVVALIEAPGLERVRRLELDGVGVGERGVEALARSEALATVRSLRLSGPEVERLVGSPLFDGVDTLSFSNAFDMTKESIDALARWPGLQRVRSLNLRAVRPASAVLERLLQSEHLTGLRALFLDSAAVGDDGARLLAENARLETLERLHLQNCRIGLDGARAIARSRHLARLEHLDLGSNPIGDLGANAFANSRYMSNLRRLDLSTGWKNRDHVHRALANSRYLDRRVRRRYAKHLR